MKCIPSTSTSTYFTAESLLRSRISAMARYNAQMHGKMHEILLHATHRIDSLWRVSWICWMQVKQIGPQQKKVWKLWRYPHGELYRLSGLQGTKNRIHKSTNGGSKYNSSGSILSSPFHNNRSTVFGLLQHTRRTLHSSRRL